MLKNILLPVLAAVLLTLLPSAPAQAWGGFHVGFTHIGPGGITHWGRTAVGGPFGGAAFGSRFGAYGGYRGYGGLYGAGYHYGVGDYGGYYGGVRYGYAGYRY